MKHTTFIISILLSLIASITLHAGNNKPGGGKDCNCLKYTIPFGGLPHEEGLENGSIRILQDDTNPLAWQPQVLFYDHPVFSRIRGNTVDAVSGEQNITIWSGRHYDLFYTFKDGESLAKLGGKFTYYRDVLERLDENRQPTGDSESVAYFRFYNGDGDTLLYDATTGYSIEYQYASGRVVDFSYESCGLEVVLDEAGAIRQVKAPQGLADIITLTGGTEEGFDVRIYDDSVASDSKTNGLYQATGNPYVVYEIRAGAEADKVVITERRGGKSWIYEAEGSNVDNYLISTYGDGAYSQLEQRYTDEATGNSIMVYEQYDASGGLLSRWTRESVFYPWAEMTIKEVTDPDGIALTTLYDYYTDPNEGSYAQRKSTIQPDGRWEAFTYDSEGRLYQTIKPYMDAPAQPTTDASDPAVCVIENDYTPHIAEDTLDVYDERPRTIIEKVQGVVTSKTFCAYYFNANNQFVEVKEIATDPAASYGDASNLRTEKIYYAPDHADAELAGRLYRELRPNGTAEQCSYARDAQERFIETCQMLTHDGAENVTPVVNKSTQETHTFDVRGNEIKTANAVYDGSAWQQFSCMVMDYDDEMQHTKTRVSSATVDIALGDTSSGRITYEAEWVDGEKEAVIDEAGTRTEYTYDSLKKLSTETKIVPGGDNILTSYMRDIGVADCSCDKSVSTVITAGSLQLTRFTESDKAGRSTQMIDENGYLTSYTYADGGRITTRINPDGSTVTTENYIDGRVKSITGTDVVDEYYTYGVNADGTQYTQVNLATASSPRYSKTTTDIAGRLLEQERPAFGTGTNVTAYFYKAKNLLEKMTQPEMADTLYEYDDLANMVRSGLDVSANGTLDLASADRITDSDTVIAQTGSDWFRVTTSKVYPDTSSATAVTTSISKQRLSGFTSGASGILASETIVTDIHGNDTVSATSIDRTAKTVTQTTDTPESTITATRVIVDGELISENSNTVTAATTYGYDALERLISVKDSRHANASQIVYVSGKNQVQKRIDAAGNETEYTYVAQGTAGAGQVATQEDALGQMTYFEYDLLGRQIRFWGETDYPVSFGYDSYNQMQTLTTYRDDAGTYDFSTATWPNPTGGDLTTWVYDEPTGLLTEKQYPAAPFPTASDPAVSHKTTYTYTAAGRLSQRSWARGVDTDYTYDQNTGELLSVDYSDTTADIAYTYDRLGRMSTVADATGTRTFAYDATDLRLDTETLSSGFYEGRVLARKYKTGTEAALSGGYTLTHGSTTEHDVSYSYTNSRLSQVSDQNSTFSYTYVTDSDLLATLTSPAHNTTNSYEPNRDVRTVVDNQVSSTSVSKYTYTYDAIARRTSRAQEGTAFAQTNTDTFTYNPRSEVVDSSNGTLTDREFGYNYDAIGNRIMSQENTEVTEYESNALNQYSELSVNSVLSTPTYDADGNMLTDAQGRSYTWTGENRLQWVEPALPQSGDTKSYFEYDYMGRRVNKQVFTYNGSAWTQTANEGFIYDGWNMIAFLNNNATSTLDTTCTWGMDLSGTMQGAGGVGGLLSCAAPGVSYTYTYDANGNVSELIDTAGTTAAHYEYGPFGQTLVSTGTYSDNNPYRFSTKYTDDETDLLYYGYRYYDPAMGRWLNRDPIEERGGMNVYAFVGNDGVNKWDLLGQKYVPIPNVIPALGDMGGCVGWDSGWEPDSDTPGCSLRCSCSPEGRKKGLCCKDLIGVSGSYLVEFESRCYRFYKNTRNRKVVRKCDAKCPAGYYVMGHKRPTEAW